MSKHWPVKKLGEVCEVRNGATPRTDQETLWGGPHAWITPAEMGSLETPYISATRRTLTDAGLAACSATLAPPRSVILSCRAPIGHLVINEVPMATNQGCKSLVPGSLLDHKFLFYFLKANVELLDSLGTGATFRELSAGKLKEVLIPVPPLAEQQRIVAKLDEILTEIEASRDTLRLESVRIDQVRRSAIDTLMAELSSGTQALAEISEVFADGDWIESKDQSNSGIRLVQTGNVGNGVFKDRRDKARWISEETFTRLNCTEIHPGDILISRLPDPVGRACLIPETGDRMITAVDCTIVRPKKTVMDPEFLVLYASSTSYDTQVRAMITGTTRDRISRKNLGSVAIPVPSLSEQQEVVARAAQIGAACGGLGENVDRRDELCQDLRQSILEAAFRGEL